MSILASLPFIWLTARAVLGASLFALVALWIAGDMPGAPLGAAEGRDGKQPQTRDASLAEA